MKLNLQHYFWKIHHNLRVDTATTRVDSRKGLNNKVRMSLLYPIWHVNKLNFKYFRSSPTRIHKIFTEYLLNQATVFFLASADESSLESARSFAIIKKNKNRLAKKLLMNFHTTPRVLADDAFNRSSEWRLNKNFSLLKAKAEKRIFLLLVFI